MCAHAVLAYVDLALNMNIHYLRFPVAVEPAGQLNNGLFLPCFLLNSHVAVFEQGRSCTVIKLALNSPVARFEITASMVKDTIEAEGGKQKHPPDVLIC